jgi:hypothetical protein
MDTPMFADLNFIQAGKLSGPEAQQTPLVLPRLDPVAHFFRLWLPPLGISDAKDLRHKVSHLLFAPLIRTIADKHDCAIEGELDAHGATGRKPGR